MIKYVKWWLFHIHTHRTYMYSHIHFYLPINRPCVLLLAIFFSLDFLATNSFFYDHFCYCLMLLLLLVLWRWWRRRLLLLLLLLISLSFNSSIQLSHSVKVNFGIFDWPSKILLQRLPVWVYHSLEIHSYVLRVFRFVFFSSSPLLPLPSPASSSSSATHYFFGLSLSCECVYGCCWCCS